MWPVLALVAAVVTLVGPSAPTAGFARASLATTAPIVAAAGDISCDPADPSFNAGSGTTTACRHRSTSDLLMDATVFPTLDAVLLLGDVQYEDGAYAKFLQSYDPAWGRVKSLTRPAPGNHDYSTSGAAGYFDYFGPAAGDRSRGYYSFDLGGWHVVSLNSNCAQVGGCGRNSSQTRWLRSDLAAHPSACTLAYWHHPRFSSGPHGSDATYKAIWQTLYTANADLVLVGHDHGYERFAPQNASGGFDPARGIREFVVGTGGKSLYGFPNVRPNSQVRSSTYGVLKLTLGSSGYDWRFVAVPDSPFTDAGSDACH